MTFSLANIFGGAPNAAPAQPAAPAATPTPVPPVPGTPVQPGNIPPDGGTPAAATPGTDLNAAVPPVDPAAPATPDSPLDQFKSLWEPVTTEGDPTPAAPAALDPAKLQEIISKADFTKSITPENLAKINAGGEEATQATIEAMNIVAQNVLMQATLASNKMQEQAIADALATQAATIPDLIKSQTTANNLTKANPIFSNPAVKPVIEAVQAQLAAKNPTATADQLTEMAQNFVAVMGAEFAPKPPVDPSAPVLDTTDWDKYLNG